jgi:molybdopterin-guanine dinucleotide biosynthesis protein A
MAEFPGTGRDGQERATAAGFVLVGGRSSRMGRDKAHLPYGGGTLAAHVAAAVTEAAGSAVLIGDPGRYSGLGYPVIGDVASGAGPLAGICAALETTSAEWNLIVACDMPGVTAGFLKELLGAAAGDCTMAAGPSRRPEPLCGVWRRRCVGPLRQALDGGIRKITSALAGLQVQTHFVADEALLRNLNTPEEWAGYMAISTDLPGA